MTWFLTNLLILVGASFGHVAAVRAALSGWFKVRLSEWLWITIASLHGFAAAAVPFAMFRRLAFSGRGPRLLGGGTWEAVPWGWRTYIALSLAAAIGAIALTMARRCRRPPPAERSRRCTAADVTAALGRKPAGRGVKAFVARLPGNALFDLELVELELALPGLPPEWDGLSVLHLTDTHFNGTPDRSFFEHAVQRAERWQPDVAVLTGDNLDAAPWAAWLPTTLGRLDPPLGRYFILGNHDVYHGGDAIRAALAEAGWSDVARKPAIIEPIPIESEVISPSIRLAHGERLRGETALDPLHRNATLAAAPPLWIAGTERPWAGDHPDVATVPPGAFRLLLSHTPHHFAWACTHGIDLVLAGHLHGGQICVPLLGPLGAGAYASGLFQRGRTVMYVSRGLGVITPIRWRCRPEMTKLVLRSLPHGDAADQMPHQERPWPRSAPSASPSASRSRSPRPSATLGSPLCISSPTRSWWRCGR